MDKTDRNFYLAKGQENIEIRQYMSLDNLIAQLASGNYYVKKKKRFEDANEASMPIKYAFGIAEACRPLRPADHKMDAEQRERFNRFKEYCENFVSCWTTEPNENIFMWKCYAPDHGVCIKSKINKFLKSFDARCWEDYRVEWKPVQYRQFDFQFDPKETIFIKDPAYKFESEMRFLFIPRNMDEDEKHRRRHILLPVNHKVMIDEVILSPYMSKDTAKVLKSYIEKELECKVTHSRIKLNK